MRTIEVEGFKYDILMGRRGTEQVVSSLGKDELSALDIQGREDCSDEARIEQLIAPAFNKTQMLSSVSIV